MQKIQMLKLGQDNRDLASQQIGQLTHAEIRQGGAIRYFFQPRGLNPKTGEPHDKLLVEAERMETKDYKEVEVPMEILGSVVTDNASGFTGIAISFVQHINGCFHVVLQPSDILAETGTTAKPHDFDLRGCSGEKIPVLTEEQREESTRRTPSPTGDKFPQ